MAVALEFCRRLGKEYDQLINRQFQVAAQHRGHEAAFSWSATVTAGGAKSSNFSTSDKAGGDGGDGDDNASRILPSPAAAKNSCSAPEQNTSQPLVRAAAASTVGGAKLSAPNAESRRPLPPLLQFRVSPVQQLIRALIHAITFGLAYILMLLAMYFNGYIIISIIIGSAIGKFLCDWMVVQIFLDDGSAGGENGGPAVLAARNALPRGCEEPTICCV